MSRTVATVWHASLSALAALLYFLFVLPRWWELTGFAPHTLGTVMRILLGLLIGATAVPVSAALKQARKPEFGTPQLALSLLSGAAVAPLVAGTLILGTAISEIWLSLDDAGMWLFGIYGAAAAIALLGIGAFYLASVAEQPAPPPKPIKLKTPKQPKRGRRGKKAEAAESEAEAEAPVEDADETVDAGDDEADGEDAAEETVEVEADDAAEETVEAAAEEAGDTEELRPTGKRQAKKDG
ncbi:hypothetical protein MU0083_003647 [[Mycobacterium] kokjensenii]|uniref:Transmembrane protein n=1 Tax=[Mycobacterium] kokjensenii TaxID=3064287 RepID=A0ABM9LV73_9MYCO|nr:hypothetical protein [Mycolicibacter sp. MU0083]CAJ1505259.1 hypothetical protein MU0083_003647 [Mycolicibacter sp. MU0083]